MANKLKPYCELPKFPHLEQPLSVCSRAIPDNFRGLAPSRQYILFEVIGLIYIISCFFVLTTVEKVKLAPFLITSESHQNSSSWQLEVAYWPA